MDVGTTTGIVLTPPVVVELPVGVGGKMPGREREMDGRISRPPLEDEGEGDATLEAPPDGDGVCVGPGTRGIRPVEPNRPPPTEERRPGTSRPPGVLVVLVDGVVGWTIVAGIPPVVPTSEGEGPGTLVVLVGVAPSKPDKPLPRSLPS